MNELIAITQQYEERRAQKKRKKYMFYVILAVIITVGWVYFSFFNIHYEVVSYEGWNKPEAEYGQKIVHSSVICLKIPSEYEGKEIISNKRYDMG